MPIYHSGCSGGEIFASSCNYFACNVFFVRPFWFGLDNNSELRRRLDMNGLSWFSNLLFSFCRRICALGSVLFDHFVCALDAALFVLVVSRCDSSAYCLSVSAACGELCGDG